MDSTDAQVWTIEVCFSTVVYFYTVFISILPILLVLSS